MKRAVHEAIARHAADLRRIFPEADPYPIRLYRRLCNLEHRAHRMAERACCDRTYTEAEGEAFEARARELLRDILGEGSERVLLNPDPRGYALKLELREGETLEGDWGGYGLIAPDLYR